MIDAISAIEEYVFGYDEASFLKTRLVQDGVIRQVQIIGEAAKKVSEGLKKEHPELPWKDMAGMRNKLVHDYFGVDIKSVWKTATIDIPELKKYLSKLPVK
jgi:uncharacterized protein with HEPN domain